MEKEIVAEVVVAFPIVSEHLLGADKEFLVGMGYDEPTAHFDDSCVGMLCLVTEERGMEDIVGNWGSQVCGGIHPDASILG